MVKKVVQFHPHPIIEGRGNDGLFNNETNFG